MSNNQLCWDCEKAYGQCSWLKNFKPVKGWVAKPNKIKTCTKDGGFYYIESYLIEKCPLFKKEKIIYTNKGE